MTGPILQVVGNGDPGGGTTAVLTLATMLRAAGEPVAVVSQRGSYLLHMAEQAGVPAFGLDFTPRHRAMGAFAQIARLARQQGARLVHAHGGRAGLPVALAASLGALPGVPMVYTVHGFHFLAKEFPGFQLGRLAERLCIATAARTIFVSEGDRRIAATQRLLPHADRSAVIPNAVTGDEMPEVDGPDCDIAFVGRLTEQKNPLLLAEILRALRPLKPTLRVIGGGPLEAALIAALQAAGVREQVELCGLVPRPRALELMARCRMLVLPSRWEGHPITLIEAMHLGLPVVASRISGSDEIVRPGRNGFLVEATDPLDYANALRMLLQDEARRRSMARAAQDDADTRFSAATMLGAHRKLYAEVLSLHHPAPEAKGELG